MTETGDRCSCPLPSPFRDPVAIGNRSLPGLSGGEGGSSEDCTTREGHAGPRDPQVPTGPGSAPRAGVGEAAALASGQRSPVRSPSAAEGSSDLAVGGGQEPPKRATTAAAAHAPAPRRSLALPCRCPQSGPRWLRPSVGRSHEPQREDERGGTVAGTAFSEVMGRTRERS
jgi:hypothetical protein